MFSIFCWFPAKMVNPKKGFAFPTRVTGVGKGVVLWAEAIGTQCRAAGIPNPHTSRHVASERQKRTQSAVVCFNMKRP